MTQDHTTYDFISHFFFFFNFFFFSVLVYFSKNYLHFETINRVAYVFLIHLQVDGLCRTADRYGMLAPIPGPGLFTYDAFIDLM